MLIQAKTKAYSLRLDIKETGPAGMVETRLVYQRQGEPDEIVIEKIAPLSSVKQLMDGVFRELFIATGEKTC
jgi:hypothetical protein